MYKKKKKRKKKENNNWKLPARRTLQEDPENGEYPPGSEIK